MSFTNAVEREDRLAWCWKIVEGAATVSYREYKSANGTAVFAQGLSLPFSDRINDGTGIFFTHTNWRPQGSDWIDGNVKGDLQVAAQKSMHVFASGLQKY